MCRLRGPRRKQGTLARPSWFLIPRTRQFHERGHWPSGANLHCNPHSWALPPGDPQPLATSLMWARRPVWGRNCENMLARSVKTPLQGRNGWRVGRTLWIFSGLQWPAMACDGLPRSAAPRNFDSPPGQTCLIETIHRLAGVDATARLH